MGGLCAPGSALIGTAEVKVKKTVYILAVMVILAGILVAGCGGSTSDSSAPVTDPESAATTPAQPGKVHELTFATFQPETNAITGINTELMREIEQRTPV